MIRIACLMTCFVASISAESVSPKIEIEEKKIVMYYRPTCYYCIKVKRILDELKIPVVYKDISDPVYLEELIRIGGKKQVPCLIIEDQVHYESSKIISVLQS